MKKSLFYCLICYYKIEFLFTRLFTCKEENSILLVRTDNIGDFLLFLDSAREYRKHFLQKIILLCNHSCVELARKTPYFDEVISLPFDRNEFWLNPLYRIRMFSKLCRRKFNKIINSCYSREFFVQDITIKNLNAIEKIAFQGSYSNTISKLRGFNFDYVKCNSVSLQLKQRGDRVYSKLIETDKKVKMELNRNAEFIRNTINENFVSSIAELPFELNKMEVLPPRYVIMFIGASSIGRIWSVDKWATLIDSIDENIIVCGSEKDKSIWQKIEKKIHKNCLNMLGKTTLSELCSIIKYSHYIVTNDTSAGHIAPMVKTPSVVILPGNYWGRFHPYSPERIDERDYRILPKIVFHKMSCYGCHNICKQVKDKITTWPCVGNVEVDDVLRRIDDINREYNHIK
ncbi:MAG: glycosyltransferase family 9 protein [Bacteroidales bacterium]